MVVRGFPEGFPQTDAEVDEFISSTDHLDYSANKDFEKNKMALLDRIIEKVESMKEPIGKVFKHSRSIYILCKELNYSGKCVGPILLDITGMTKQEKIDACLDLISKYGEQKVLTKLLNKLKKT